MVDTCTDTRAPVKPQEVLRRSGRIRANSTDEVTVDAVGVTPLKRQRPEKMPEARGMWCMVVFGGVWRCIVV